MFQLSHAARRKKLFIFNSGISGISLFAAATTVSGTTVTVTATSSASLVDAVFGVEYSIQDNGGSLTGYTFSKNIVGEVSAQSITVTAADGVTSDSTVTVRAYYNLDVLDDPSTRVYANDIVPYVVAGAQPSGTQTEGETLTRVQGVIAGSSPLTVTWDWQNDGGTGTWANIAGTDDDATYVLTAGDVGDDIAVLDQAANNAGSTSTRSTETGAIASAVDADAQAIIDACTTPPNAAQQTAINDFVVACKAIAVGAGTAWSECDNIGVFCLGTGTEADALRDWKAPAGTAFTKTNSPTYTSKQGYTAAAGAWINSPANLSTLTKFQQNDAHMSVYVLVDGTDNDPVGGVAGSGDQFIRTKGSTANNLIRINNVAGSTASGITNGTGLHLGRLINSTSGVGYVRGTNTLALTGTTNAPTAQKATFGSGSTGQNTAQLFSFASLGSGANWSDQDVADFTTAVNALVTAMGAA